MKRKRLPSKKHKGMYIYCSKKECRKYFSWTNKAAKNEKGVVIRTESLCGISKKKLSVCKHSEKHKFIVRVYVSGTKDRRISKTLDAEDYSEALIKAIDYENEFANKIKIVNPTEKKIMRKYLFDTQIQYFNFLENIDVPEHKKKVRSEKHLKGTLKNFTLFNEALAKNKVNKKITLIERISDEHVAFFHSYLLIDKKYENRTYNNKMNSLRSFFSWAIKTYNLNMNNPFNEVQKRAQKTNIDTISKEEFKELLEIISPENGIAQTGSKITDTRNMYKSYLKDGIELSLHTGGRREEVVNLKWDMISEIDGQPTYITVRNLKVERQKGEGFSDNVAPKIIPITKSLIKLLYRMGYEKKRGSYEYLLSPDRTGISSKTIMENLSKGFSHFYNQLETGRKLQLKSLRKTYLTYLNSALSNDTKSLSSHSTNEVLEKHYIDKRIVNKAVKELNIFDV